MYMSKMVKGHLTVCGQHWCSLCFPFIFLTGKSIEVFSIFLIIIIFNVYFQDAFLYIIFEH